MKFKYAYQVYVIMVVRNSNIQHTHTHIFFSTCICIFVIHGCHYKGIISYLGAVGKEIKDRPSRVSCPTNPSESHYQAPTAWVLLSYVDHKKKRIHVLWLLYCSVW
eukprot:TRINITY_DN57_c1_g1_i6.p1 TRINITY_DN57_c1_g1~~TRINITY_DN57_c1_g1_i6.p1  ORF type:complete len:106 (-),score=1.38 TRINITY_DN57_c1_g1_i6:393-710(-)